MNQNISFRRAARMMVSVMLVALGAIAINVSTPFADEPKPQADTAGDTTKETDQPPKMTDQLRAMNDLQAAHLLVDCGRRAKSAEMLLAAARIFATVPVQPLNVQIKDGDTVLKADPQADMKKLAEKLVEEARSLAEELPQVQADAINALADSLSGQMKVRLRGAVGGAKQYNGFVPAGQNQVVQFDLVGGFTSIAVEIDPTQADPADNLNVRVIGSLSGLEYGSGNTAPNGSVRVNFTHFLVAKVSVIITNQGVGDVPFTLRTN